MNDRDPGLDPHSDDGDEPDDAADPTVGRAVPHPMDRVWRHPSELGAPTRPGRHRPRRARRFATTRPVPSVHRVVVPVGAALVGAGATLAIVTAFGSVDLDRVPAAEADRPPARSTATQVVNRLAPSVVAVSARDSNGLRRGSGIVLRHKGEVLTNARLVRDAVSVTVLTVDGERVGATVVGIDHDTDLALLTLRRELVAAPLAPDLPGIGQEIYAISADPRGHATPRVSRGIVSSVDGLVAERDGPVTSGLIEADTLAEASAAGGAIVDDEGFVVGIVLAPIGERQGALAVPIGEAIEVASHLRRGGAAAHGRLGLHGIDTPHGPAVRVVEPHGPAHVAGLQTDDRILSVDGRSVDSMTEVTAIVRSHWPGEPVTVRVRRGGRFLDRRVVLGAPGTWATTAEGAIQTIGQPADPGPE
jgi:putative serine protease PepD